MAINHIRVMSLSDHEGTSLDRIFQELKNVQSVLKESRAVFDKLTKKLE